jgi:hypothetical protein
MVRFYIKEKFFTFLFSRTCGDSVEPEETATDMGVPAANAFRADNEKKNAVFTRNRGE